MTSSQDRAHVAGAAWRWVLDQVRWDDGPWVPTSVPVTEPGTEPASDQTPPWDRDGLHSGVGGLAHVLAEVRLARPWTDEESGLAAGIGERLRAQVASNVDCTFFDGLGSTVGALVALGEPGVGDVLDRLGELATPDGWPQTAVGEPAVAPGARVNDLTLGTAGVLLAAVWAGRPEAGQDPATLATAARLANHAADVLLAEREPTPTGTTWSFVPARFRLRPGSEMPNLSHGLAGIAAALAVAGAELDRDDLVAAARSGAEHLVTLGRREGDGFVVPRQVPTPPGADLDEVTWTWCHGPTGTSLAFAALEHAGVTEVAGEPSSTWHRRCLSAVRSSGVPARLRPGFWDNDGRCCGTAGVADVVLDSWHRTGEEDDRLFLEVLLDALVDRALLNGPHATWRFLEHRADDPLLPPGVGWMQGVAGIAGVLLKAARVLPGRSSVVVPRMDTWWSLGGAQTGTSSTAPTA